MTRLPGRDLDAIIGANLRRLREGACLSAAALATRVGLHPDRLAAVEEGDLRLRPDELLAMTRALGCGVDALFDDPRPRRIAS